MIYVTLYLCISTGLAVYMYFDTLKDRKFRSKALRFALLMYIWPFLFLVILYAMTIELMNITRS